MSMYLKKVHGLSFVPKFITSNAFYVYPIMWAPICNHEMKKESLISMTFSLHSASISRILEPSPQGLISSAS